MHPIASSLFGLALTRHSPLLPPHPFPRFLLTLSRPIRACSQISASDQNLVPAGGLPIPCTSRHPAHPYRPHVVHTGQGHKVGLYTPTILGGNSYLNWFYDRGAIKDPAHTGTSKGIAQAIIGGPLRKFLPNYANVYVTIQSHALSAGVWIPYVTANGVRNVPARPQRGPPLYGQSSLNIEILREMF